MNIFKKLFESNSSKTDILTESTRYLSTDVDYAVP